MIVQAISPKIGNSSGGIPFNFTYTGTYTGTATDDGLKVKFTTSGTLTIQTGQLTTTATIVGGGGGGANWYDSDDGSIAGTYSGSGGSGGIQQAEVTLRAGESYKFVLGAGGSGKSGWGPGTGGTGGTSTAFGYTCTGGTGGDCRNSGGTGGTGGSPNGNNGVRGATSGGFPNGGSSAGTTATANAGGTGYVEFIIP